MLLRRTTGWLFFARWSFLPAAVVWFALAVPAQGQFYFGKNKIQYTNFEWQVMTTTHFRIYFYLAEVEVAQVAARLAEEAYPKYAAQFNHEIDYLIPLIIYSSPSHFSQTNVVPGLLPESVGGFTEFLKGRVVVPYHGSYFDFEHVIRHELVHVFTISRIVEAKRRETLRRTHSPPLWLIEGLAEHWSETWDTEADMIVKDLVLNDQILPITEFWRIRGSYFMYKLGQSVCKYITETYGPEKLTLLFDNWVKGRDLNQVMVRTLGVGQKKLSDEWMYWLKKRYYPELADQDLPHMEAAQLTYDGYALKGVPLTWDDGHGTQEWLIYMAYRRGYSGLYMKPRRARPGSERILVKGNRSSKFESLHLLRTGIDVSPSGKIAFSSKSHENDHLYIYDLAAGEITSEFRTDSLIAARSPCFSPDETQLVFSGIRPSGHADLFLLDLATGDYRPLTDDVYQDIDPAFSPDGSKIIFASDRGAFGYRGATNLYELDLTDPTGPRALTWGDYRDQTPEVTERGVYFSSNRERSYNLFLLKADGEISRLTNFATGAFDPRLSADGEHIIFSGYDQTQFRTFQIEHPSEEVALPSQGEPDTTTWVPQTIAAKFSRTSIKYDTDYSFDIAQSSIAYDPIYGSSGGFQASFSDILGDRAYYLLLANSARTKDEFLTAFNIGVAYVNRERRLNWGIAGFHLYDEYYNTRDQYYFERQAGLMGFFSYPISKFARFDLTSFARYDKKDRRFGLADREGFLVTTFVSWIYDNSIWDISGPIEGRRYNLSAGLTQSISDGQSWNRIVFGDIRHYQRLGRNSALANRLFGYYSNGLEPRRIYFGGSWSFRGYGRHAFYARKIVFSSTELRFPFIDALKLGLPFGAIGFSSIRGALFFDVGNAWEEDFDEWLGSFGGGFRVPLAGVVLLRFDLARTTDFEYISPGWDFDFFFGWNF